MKKKLIVVVSALLLVVLLAACLVACNSYKWKSIGGGDKNAPVESNGGYVVKQGNYLYYINGYEGSDGKNNTFGTPVKQSIVRSEIDENGVVDNSTTKVVVPKIIYNSSAKGGFAIFGEWIYYASPNSDRDKNGTASTTDTDFMRTKIDGSVTQRMGKINTRSAEYLFTPTRVLYYTSNKISYIDFSGMKTNKNIENAAGAKEGVLVENVSSVAWKLGYDTIFYTQTVTGNDSYKNYNELYSISVLGENKVKLATEDTFLANGELAVDNPQKVYKYTLRDLYIESDGTPTIYYTTTRYINETDETVGLFCAKAADAVTFKSNVKELNNIGSTTLYPLGYTDGALAYNSANIYCWYNGENANEPLQTTTSSQTIWYVDQEAEVAYFTASSSATALFKISYKEAVDNATTVISEGIKVDWLRLDFLGDELYFFATNDSNLMHSVNIKEFDRYDEEAKSNYVGFVKEEEEEKKD